MPSELIAAVETGGDVPVIVGLSSVQGFRPEALLQPDDGALQRQQMLQARDAVATVMASVGGAAPIPFELIPFVSARVNAAGLAALRNSPAVASIQENRRLELSLQQSTGIVGAPAAWAAGYSGTGWTVAVLDTGVDRTHPFLAGKVLSEACYSNDGGFGGAVSLCPGGVGASVAAGSGMPCQAGLPGCDHGTHVAGIAAGRGSTFSGVARDASLVSIQVFTQFGNSVSAFETDVLRGLERVFALRTTFPIAAVNMSLGGGQYYATCDSLKPAFKFMFDALWNAGIAPVVASGNNGFFDSISSPACISSAVSVGSTTDGSGGVPADRIANSSNTAAFLSLLAPGEPITSSLPQGQFGARSGTSMATPHVAGAWAILRQRSPTAAVGTILNALRATATYIRDPLNGIAFPRINIGSAAATLCAYAVSRTVIPVAAAAAAESVSVTASAGCSWSASSHASWLSITSGSPGSGHGTVGIGIASNPGAPRTGTLTIAGWTVTVNQDAAPAPPSVITYSATDVTTMAATLHGTVNPNGASTTASFEYGTSNAPYSSVVAAAPGPGAGRTPVEVSASIGPLACGMVYYFRVAATNAHGTTRGAEHSFYTPSCPLPTVTTVYATEVTRTSATLNGLVNPNGLPTTVVFDYGGTASYGGGFAATQSPLEGGNTVVAVSVPLTGLSCSNVYHFRVVAISWARSDGADAFFVTRPCPIPFTDNVLVQGASSIRRVHITELRERIHALRVGVGLPPFDWSPLSSSGTDLIRAAHLVELRTALAQVYASMNRAAPVYTDPALVPGVTAMKAAHVRELRAAVIELE